MISAYESCNAPMLIAMQQCKAKMQSITRNAALPCTSAMRRCLAAVHCAGAWRPVRRIMPSPSGTCLATARGTRHLHFDCACASPKTQPNMPSPPSNHYPLLPSCQGNPFQLGMPCSAVRKRSH
jgi:hypothetical protein